MLRHMTSLVARTPLKFVKEHLYLLKLVKGKLPKRSPQLFGHFGSPLRFPLGNLYSGAAVLLAAGQRAVCSKILLYQKQF